MPANSIKGYCPYSSFVGNKAKGRISKRVLEENKACQINFPKNQHFVPPPLPPPLIRTRSPFCVITDDFHA